MNTPLISVIVPIYGVEKYLPKCLDSIICQTYQNLEIILVDDGSPDGCGIICDQYADRDKRIKVIHKTNGGLSSARNAGIDVSTGRYLSFIDSDDFVSPYFIEILYKGIVFNDSDISSVATGINFTDGEEENIVFANDGNDCSIFEIEPYVAIQLIMYQRLPNGAPWRMYKREIFSEIRFPIGYLYEDTATTHRTFMKAKKMALIRAKIYAYRIRKDSIIRRKFSSDKLIATVIADQIVNDVLAYDVRLQKAACSRAFALCYQVFIQIPVYDRKSLKTMWRIMRKYRNVVIGDHSPEIRIKNKVGAYCTYFGMYISLIAGKIFKKVTTVGLYNINGGMRICLI